MRYVLALLVLLVAAPVSADTVWQLDYATSGNVSEQHTFYGPGTYFFLSKPAAGYVTVYLEGPGPNYGATFLGFYGEATLPESMPPIVFPAGIDQIAAVPITTPTEPPPPVSVPEPGSAALVGLGLVAAMLGLLTPYWTSSRERQLRQPQ